MIRDEAYMLTLCYFLGSRKDIGYTLDLPFVHNELDDSSLPGKSFVPAMFINESMLYSDKYDQTHHDLEIMKPIIAHK